MTSQAPPPQIFINEDVSKPENRTNLALFALMNVLEFKTWFNERLGLALGAIVYPPKNDRGGRRPDFVVVDLRGETAAWIEVELGQNPAQLQDYQEILGASVKSINGKREDKGDLSLEEICERLQVLRPKLDPQHRVSADLLIQLVTQEVLEKVRVPFDYQIPGEHLKALPFIHALLEQMGHHIRFGVPPASPGEVLITTITQHGWTLRVYSPINQYKSVALMWDQSVGGRDIHLNSFAHIAKYLPPEKVAKWADGLKANMGIDIRSLEENRRLSVKSNRMEQAARIVAQLILDMVSPSE